MNETVRLAIIDGRIESKPTQYLGGTRFTAYLDATRGHGCRFDAARKVNIVQDSALLDVIRSLSVAGFTVEIDEHLDARLAEAKSHANDRRDAAKTLHDAAIARMDAIDAELAAKGLALYPYQRDGVRWLSHRKGAGLFDEMGLGKTVQALIAAPEGVPIVVVAPSAVKGVWVNEARKWRSDLGWPRMLSGRHSFRWPSAGELVVTNYDILPPLDQTPNPAHASRPLYSLPYWVGEPVTGTILIFDECHMLKSPKANRTKAARLLARKIRGVDGMVWGLTGTPLLNRPQELWHVLTAMSIAEEAYGSWAHFNAMFDYSGNPRAQVADRLKMVSLMRRRDEVLPDLPVKSYTSVGVPLDEGTRAIADAIIERLEAAGLRLDRVHEWAEIVAATKTANLTIGEISRVRAALAGAKIGRLVELVEQYEAEGKALVVFSAHRAPIDLLAQRDGWGRITGEDDSTDRTATVKRFASGEMKGIACTIRAAGVGIDGLQRASHNVVFVDLDWTPGWNQQAEDRCCRIGQDRGVNIVTMIADHLLDQKVTELLAAKTRIIEGAVNASAREMVEEQFPDLAPSASPLPVKVKTAAEVKAATVAKVVPMPRLWALFESLQNDTAARKGLIRPSLALEDLALHVAGRASKYCGDVMITNNRPFGHEDARWYGRITPEGFVPSGMCVPEVLARLQSWEDDPAALTRDAAAYGHRTGQCCFCSTMLTDARSVTVGYGPICADRWGLPWGESEDQTVPLFEAP